jgi:hypothetical protein
MDSFSMISTTAGGSNLSTMTLQPPHTQIGTKRYPEPWLIGPTWRHLSPGSTGG